MAFLIGGLGDVPFYNHETRIFFFTLLALSYIVLRNDIVSQSTNQRGIDQAGQHARAGNS
jgi:hypothetical protein